LKGAHHPKIRNAVPIVFPRHSDNMVNMSERRKHERKRSRMEGNNGQTERNRARKRTPEKTERQKDAIEPQTQPMYFEGGTSSENTHNAVPILFPKMCRQNGLHVGKRPVSKEEKKEGRQQQTDRKQQSTNKKSTRTTPNRKRTPP
jgi:hypothetical protein